MIPVESDPAGGGLCANVAHEDTEKGSKDTEKGSRRCLLILSPEMTLGR